MIRLIIVAPYPTTRAGLRSVLTEADDLDAVADIADLDDLPALLDEHVPDVLLIDLVDDPADGAIDLAQLAQGEVLPPVVMLTGSPAEALAGLSIPHTSLLLRDASPDEIRTAVRSAVAGLISVDPRVIDAINAQLDWQRESGPVDEQAPSTLTPRESQVLQGIARGWPNKTIAVELGISEHTVKFHVGSIFEKLGVASRSEAIAVAARHGLLVL